MQEGVAIGWGWRARGGGRAGEGEAAGGKHGLGAIEGTVRARYLARWAAAGWGNGRHGNRGRGTTAVAID